MFLHVLDLDADRDHAVGVELGRFFLHAADREFPSFIQKLRVLLDLASGHALEPGGDAAAHAAQRERAAQHRAIRGQLDQGGRVAQFNKRFGGLTLKK